MKRKKKLHVKNAPGMIGRKRADGVVARSVAVWVERDDEAAVAGTLPGRLGSGTGSGTRCPFDMTVGMWLFLCVGY